LLGEKDVLLADPDVARITGVDTDWIRDQLVEMKGQMAECFWLCCVDEMSYADVANQLGISTSHVGVNVHRARELLKKRLADLACEKKE